MDLRDSKAVRGVVTRKHIDYYKFPIADSNSSYEITVTPISGGNPDLVLSLDSKNEFPTYDNNTVSSTNIFDTDSVTITKSMIERAKAKYFFIGIVTSDADTTVYSLVVARKTKFNPLELQTGVVLSG